MRLRCVALLLHRREVVPRRAHFVREVVRRRLGLNRQWWVRERPRGRGVDGAGSGGRGRGPGGGGRVDEWVQLRCGEEGGIGAAQTLHVWSHPGGHVTRRPSPAHSHPPPTLREASDSSSRSSSSRSSRPSARATARSAPRRSCSAFIALCIFATSVSSVCGGERRGRKGEEGTVGGGKRRGRKRTSIYETRVLKRLLPVDGSFLSDHLF